MRTAAISVFNSISQNLPLMSLMQGKVYQQEFCAPTSSIAEEQLLLQQVSNEPYRLNCNTKKGHYQFRIPKAILIAMKNSFQSYLDSISIDIPPNRSMFLRIPITSCILEWELGSFTDKQLLTNALSPKICSRTFLIFIKFVKDFQKDCQTCEG